MRYIIAILRRFSSIIYLSFIKIIKLNKFEFSLIPKVSVSTKFSIIKGKIILGKGVGTRKNVEFRVSDGGNILIGSKCFFNNGCLICCKDKIVIGDSTQIGPNVMIFDHDHDFRQMNGLASKKFKCSQVIIGNNVWIGANCVILRGTVIGDNCVVAAGTILSGVYDKNKLIVQKKDTEVKDI